MIVDNFVDYVKLIVKSGKGGKGSTHLRREKYIPKGGPDGGNGGNGGSIIVLGDSSLWTLQSFRFKKHFKAGNGGDGSGSKKSGSSGKNIIIRVPLGTVVKDTMTDKTLFEINKDWFHPKLCKNIVFLLSNLTSEQLLGIKIIQ